MSENTMQEFERTKAYLKGKLPDYLRKTRSILNLEHFNCLSPSHVDQHQSMHYDSHSHCATCSMCNARFDIFDLISQDQGFANYKDSFLRAYSMYIGPIDPDHNPFDEAFAGMTKSMPTPRQISINSKTAATMSHTTDESMDDINAIDTSAFSAITTLQLSPEEVAKMSGQRFFNGQSLGIPGKARDLKVAAKPATSPNPTRQPLSKVNAENIVDLSDAIGRNNGSPAQGPQSIVNAQFAALQGSPQRRRKPTNTSNAVNVQALDGIPPSARNNNNDVVKVAPTKMAPSMPSMQQQTTPMARTNDNGFMPPFLNRESNNNAAMERVQPNLPPMQSMPAMERVQPNLPPMQAMPAMEHVQPGLPPMQAMPAMERIQPGLPPMQAMPAMDNSPAFIQAAHAKPKYFAKPSEEMAEPNNIVADSDSDEPRFISPGVRSRDNNIFNERRSHADELTIDKDEIARRSAEIWGTPVEAPIANSTSPVVPSEPMRLENPQGPSTIINGLALDLRQQNTEQVRSKLEAIANTTPPVEPMPMRENGITSTGSTTVITTAPTTPAISPEESASAFAASLFAKANRESGSTKIVGRATSHNDAKPQINTMIIKTEPSEAMKPTTSATTTTAASPSPKENESDTIIIANKQPAAVSVPKTFNFNTHHSSTILMGSHGRMVSDEFGNLKNVSDLEKGQKPESKLKFDFGDKIESKDSTTTTTSSDGTPIVDFTFNPLEKLEQKATSRIAQMDAANQDNEEELDVFDAFVMDMERKQESLNKAPDFSISNDESGSSDTVDEDKPVLSFPSAQALQEMQKFLQKNRKLLDQDLEDSNTDEVVESPDVEFSVFDDDDDATPFGKLPDDRAFTFPDKPKAKTGERAGFPDFFSAVQQQEDKTAVQILDVDYDAPTAPTTPTTQLSYLDIDLPDLPDLPENKVPTNSEIAQELEHYQTNDFDLKSATSNEAKLHRSDNPLVSGPNLSLVDSDSTDNELSPDPAPIPVSAVSAVSAPAQAPAPVSPTVLASDSLKFPSLKHMDMSPYLLRCATRAFDNNYFTQVRGLSNETVKRFSLGFDPAFRAESVGGTGSNASMQSWQAAIIPLSEDSYLARNIAIDQSTKASVADKLRRVGQAGCFNIAALNRAEREPVFITSSEFDALSLESLGKAAVALCVPANVPELHEALSKLCTNESLRSKIHLYLCLKHTEIWQDAASELTTKLESLQLKFHLVDLGTPYEDINEALVNNPSLLEHKLDHLSEICDVNLQDANDNGRNLALLLGNNEAVDEDSLSNTKVNAKDQAMAYRLSAPNGTILCLSHVAKLSFAPLMYTISSPAVALLRLVMASLIENQQRPILFVGSSMQWQMICSLLSFNTTQGYLAKNLELPSSPDLNTIESHLKHGLMAARLSNMQQCVLMVDASSLDRSLASALSPRLAKLAMEYCAPVVVWCAPDLKSVFESNSLQSIEMSQGDQGEVVFSTLDSSCRSYTFSTLKPNP